MANPSLQDLELRVAHVNATLGALRREIYGESQPQGSQEAGRPWKVEQPPAAAAARGDADVVGNASVARESGGWRRLLRTVAWTARV